MKSALQMYSALGLTRLYVCSSQANQTLQSNQQATCTAQHVDHWCSHHLRKETTVFEIAKDLEAGKKKNNGNKETILTCSASRI